ncbi:MAG: hypothetical protein Ct9H90mP13_06980 [Pseudomonadota bacterium]|nr:MAG: hypothetical protein Ct9H90mP13_06980 [Pseudomonadota bacterium]
MIYGMAHVSEIGSIVFLTLGLILILEHRQFSFLMKEKGDLIIAGQKSGMLYAFDPDKGKTIWKKRIGKGGEHGVSIGRYHLMEKKYLYQLETWGNHPKAIGDSRSGVYAYDPFSGDELWSYDA